MQPFKTLADVPPQEGRMQCGHLEDTKLVGWAVCTR